MKTFAQFLFNNNAFIINSGLLKKTIWTGQLVRLLNNSRIHIEFQAKQFIGIRNAKMIKFNVKIFFVKLYPNGSYELLKG
jgi:hypothetical protein